MKKSEWSIKETKKIKNLIKLVQKLDKIGSVNLSNAVFGILLKC